MKTTICLKCLGLVALTATAGLLAASFETQGDFVAHEWGTFTSVQGGDGELLQWQPLQTAELPGFVHRCLLLKGEMVTLKRMETPVIYFYPDKDMNVDVRVD